jgi:hypothetical protein
MSATPEALPIIDWDLAGRALEGHAESGDAHLVMPTSKGVLVVVVDGLGHGHDAAEAARVAIDTATRFAFEPLEDLVRRCHEDLRRTRGVAMSAALFPAEPGTMSWLGVGNVEGVIHRARPGSAPARESLVLRGGVVGYRIPVLRASSLTLSAGDTLILATDGIGTAFTDLSPTGRHPGTLAGEILQRYGKDSDDALVLVARFRGASS